MPREKDIDEPMADERDLMLLDLLYGERVDDDELDDGADDSSDEVKKLGNYEDLQADLEAFSELRTLFRALPDEEPSPAVTSKLMHAAALHAPKSARAKASDESGEKRGFLGWLAGLFQPIMTHPGLAAAASLVLIVAVTGTVYLSGEKQFAEPEISPTSVAQPELEKADDEAAPATQAPSMDPAARADNAQAEGLPAPTSEASQEPKADLDGAEFGDISGRTKGNKAKRRRSNTSQTSLRAEDTGRTARAYDGKPIGKLNGAAGMDDIFDDRSASTRRGSGSSAPVTPQAVPEQAAQTAYIAADSPADESEADGDDQIAEIAVTSQAPAPSPPPPADKKAERKAPAKPAATQSKSKKRSKSAEPSQKDESPRIRSLHDEARSAAANNNCNTVREAGRMIQELDRRYYENTFRRDKKLSACFAEKSR